jgi:hypothetical protein
MERPRLTTKQAEALRNKIRPMLHFLHRCRQRLDALGFDSKGAIYQAFDRAYCALYSLHMTLHYESCAHGVGRPSDERPGATPPSDQAQEAPGLRVADQSPEPRREI